MDKTFINYRRQDSAGYAGRIHDRLKREFGDDLLFMDVTKIPLGANFAKYISDEIGKCKHLLVLIGPNWLDIPDNEGNRRLDNPNDLVRLEIAAALTRDVPVIPIFLDGAKLPKRHELPEDIQELSMRNGLDVRHASFDSDMDTLIDHIRGSKAPISPPRTLVLAIGEEDRFVTRKSDGLYKTKRTLHIRLSNNGPSKAITNCKIQITSIEPEFPVGAWVLKENFVVNAGDDVYLPLARYSEPSTKSGYHDSVIEVCLPEGKSTPQRLIEAAERHRLIIRATGMDTPFVELRCEIWIDEKGQLRVRDVGGKADKIALREAAVRAHEQLRHHDIAILAEGLMKTESDLLTWYCTAMIMPRNGKPALVMLYGRQPPSRIIEPIDVDYLSRYDFAEVDGEKEAIILEERYGNRRFIDLCLDENEVAAAIAQMKTWPA